jgi:hypothetical protein
MTPDLPPVVIECLALKALLQEAETLIGQADSPDARWHDSVLGWRVRLSSQRHPEEDPAPALGGPST